MLPLLLVVSSLSSHPSQDWQSQGKIDSREIQVEHRNGNVVEGTEFVHYEYRVSLRLSPAGQVPDWSSATLCDSVCKGKKHAAHEACDSTCDDLCKEKHHVSLKGRAVRLRDRMKEMEKQSASLAKGIGMPGGPNNWSSATSSALRNLQRDVEKEKIEMDVPHWVLPCEKTGRMFGYDQTNVEVKGEFWKVGYYMSKGVKTPIEELKGNHQGTVMRLFKPLRDPIDQGHFPDCKCKFVPSEPPVTDPGKPNIMIGRAPTFSGLGWRDKDGKVTIPDGKQVTVTSTGNGLTKVTVLIVNGSGEAYEVIIEPGTKFVPKDGGTQIMATIGQQKCSVPAKGVALLQVATEPEPTPLFDTIAELRVACTELAKHMPSKDSTFTIMPPNDPLLSRIASIEDRGFFANTIAQARVWIYTDGATMAEINKILIPGVTDGQYVNALYGLGNECSVDLSTPKYRKLLDPALAAGPTSTAEATEWYVDQLRRNDPAEGFAKTVVSKTQAAMATKAEGLDVRHAAHLAISLSDSENKATRLSALDLMDKSIPENLRTEFLGEGGQGVLVSMLTFGDDDEVKRAIEVAKKYGGPAMKQLMESFAFWGRESVRAVAEAAAKDM